MNNLNSYGQLFTETECNLLLGKEMNFWRYYESNCRSDLNKFHSLIGEEQQKKLLIWCKRSEVLLKVFKDWDSVIEVENLDISSGNIK